MKKAIQIILVVFTLSILAVSCKSAERCAAYGETHRYKVDRNF